MLHNECHKSRLLITLRLHQKSEALERREKTCHNATCNHLQVLRNLLDTLVVGHLCLLEVNHLAVQGLEGGILDTLELGLEEHLEALEALILPEVGNASLLVKLLPPSETHILELAIEARKVQLETLGCLRGLEVSHGSETLLALKLQRVSRRALLAATNKLEPGIEGAHELHVRHTLQEGTQKGLHLFFLHFLEAQVLFIEEAVLVGLHLLCLPHRHELAPATPDHVELRVLHLLQEEGQLHLVLLDLLGANE